jgi:hypothetical protein
MRPLTSYNLPAIAKNIAGTAIRRLPSFSAPVRLRYAGARAAYFGRYMVAVVRYGLKYVSMRRKMWLRKASLLVGLVVYGVVMIPQLLLLLVSSVLGGIAAAALPKEYIIDYHGELRVNWDHLLSVLKHL